MNWETYNKAYIAAPDVVKQVIDNNIIPIYFKQLKLEHSEVANNYVELVSVSTDYVLSILDSKNLVIELSKIGIGSDLSSLIISKLTSLKPNNAVIPATKEDLTSEIAEAEHALEKLSSVRTMATDMAAAQGETVHISNQDNVLAQKSAAPRWDTDN
jgi:hypothetical protein